jgi:Family of unknown function (DUF5684)
VIAALPTLASSSGGGSVIFTLIIVAIAIVELAGLWKVFTKADEHGWACIIPFYNYWCMLRIAGRPGWWLILYFIPFVNIVIILIVLWDLNKSFSKGPGWFFGLLFLGFIFFPMLGFGDSVYAGPAGPDKRPGPLAH